jgi:hypothetical protein
MLSIVRNLDICKTVVLPFSPITWLARLMQLSIQTLVIFHLEVQYNLKLLLLVGYPLEGISSSKRGKWQRLKQKKEVGGKRGWAIGHYSIADIRG